MLSDSPFEAKEEKGREAARLEIFKKRKQKINDSECENFKVGARSCSIYYETGVEEIKQSVLII